MVTMEKQILTSISNRENFICYTLKKSESYYEFLFGLLDALGIQKPDLYDGMTGKLPDVYEEIDEYFPYENEDSEIIEFMGKDKIFLVIRTKHMDKLREFIENNTEFKE